MRLIVKLVLIFWSILFPIPATAPGDDAAVEHRPAGEAARIDSIIDSIESRYANKAFSARFVQQSTLKAMDITDTATGRLYGKDPGMMRWEYETPDPQAIITDGIRLWVYRPEDNQVLIGRAPTFFGEGKGAGFLADIKTLRRQFDVSLATAQSDETLLLKLKPLKEMPDLSLVYLSVSKETYDVVEVATYNLYQDETRIRLSDLQFEPDLDDTLFQFEVPENVDVVQLDE